MAIDSYVETLDEIIQLFQEYKPGSITLDNITKLCQTLYLESFIDDINPELSRLSTASKIIVVDIDFDRIEGKVKDVKLVLASNFDNFNYFNTQTTLGNNHDEMNEHNNNILLNSLTQYPTLHEFHHNLQYIYLLDTYSQIDSDPSNSNHGTIGSTTGIAITVNNTVLTNQESITANATPTISVTAPSSSDSGKLDLFKYFTEIAEYLKQYFINNNVDYKIVANLGNIFGIYILSPEDDTPIAKIYLVKSNDPQQRLYEFVYSDEIKCWINEHAENYTTGVSLAMEILNNENQPIWFPQDLIPQELIIQQKGLSNKNKYNDSSNDKNHINKKSNLIDLFTNNSNDVIYNGKYQIINDFTTKLINITKFNVSNDNLDLVLEILNWIKWSTVVLQQVFDTVFISSNQQKNINVGNIGAHDGHVVVLNERLIKPKRRSSSIASTRRRRSSTKNKRPSIVESTMFKDEGLQQFNLHEIMVESAIDDEECNSISVNDSKMEIDNDSEMISSGMQRLLNLVICEDHVSLDNIASCTLYDGSEKWKSFIDIFKKNIC